MPEFVFPITEEQFRRSLNGDGLKNLMQLLQTDDPRFLYSCLRAGWMSKQHHKKSQMAQQEDMRIIRAALKADPKLKERLLKQTDEKLK